MAPRLQRRIRLLAELRSQVSSLAHLNTLSSHPSHSTNHFIIISTIIFENIQLNIYIIICYIRMYYIIIIIIIIIM